MNIVKTLFGKKEDLTLLPGKTTNQKAPAGIGFSASRPYGVKTAATISGIVKPVEMLLQKHAVFIRGFVDGIYGEATVDGKIYRFSADENVIHYEKEALTGYNALIPVLAYYLMMANNYEEFRNAFLTIKEQLETNKVASIEAVANFCDSFYYSIVQAEALDEIEVEENSLSLATVQQGENKSFLSPISVLQDVEMPVVTGYKPLAEVKEKKKKGFFTFDEIKAGKCRLNFSWPEEALKNIPTLESLDDYVPCEKFYLTLRKLYTRLNNTIHRIDAGLTGVDAIARDVVNFFITGKPGTGKTTMVYALAAALGLPVYSIAITKNTEEDTFEGVTKVVDGKLQFVETKFLKAFESGGIALLEEINLADPAVIMGGIGQAVEFPYVLEKNGCETTNRHPLFVAIGTFNTGTYGSKGVNQALSSRFKQTYILDDPKKEDFIAILMKSTGASNSLATWVYDAYDSINSALKGRDYNAEDICTNITMRACIGAIENIFDGEEPKIAIENTLIGKIAESDLEIAQRINEEVVENLRTFRGAIE